MRRLLEYMVEKNRFLVVLGTLLIIVYPGIAFAKDIDLAGERPTEPIFDRYGGPKSCWIIKGETTFFDSPEESEVIGIGKFLDTYYVAREKKVRGREYLLLAKVDENYKITDFVGWIRSDDGLTDRESLKTEYSIYRKALIINQWRKVKEATELEGAKVYKGPGKEYEKTKELGLFRFYYIYKRGGRPGGGDYLLLGNRPMILADKRPQDVIIGWVNAERIYEWDTRQAVEVKKDNLDERRAPVKIFKNIEDLEYHLKGIKKHPVTGEPIEPVAVEDMNVKEWPYYLQRFPIMRSHPSDFGTRLFQIGYIGDVIHIDEEGRPLGEKRLSEAERREKLKGMRREFKNIDILFVIDATGSMEYYFPSAAQAVEKIVNILREEYGSAGGLSMRFSVGFYRDYCHRPSLWKRSPLTPSDDYERVIRFIREEPVYRTGKRTGGDEPEAVFYGISTALEDAEFKEGSFRAVILIGDKGNHLQDPEGYTEEKVIERLKEKNANFFVIHVVKRVRIEQDWVVANFEKQTTKIINALPDGWGEYFINQDPSEVAEAITNAMVTMKSESERSQEATSEVVEGASLEEIKQKFGFTIAGRLVKAMEAKGIDPKVVSKRRIQIFGEGAVAEIDPRTKIKQTEISVLLSRDEIILLSAILSGFVRNVSTPKSILDLWKQILEKHLGEEYDTNIPLNEYIRKHLGLQVQENLLKYPLVKIARLRIDQIRELQSRLDEKLGDLNDIVSERITKKEKNDKGKTVRKVLPGRKQRFWTEGGMEYAWIPINALP